MITKTTYQIFREFRKAQNNYTDECNKLRENTTIFINIQEEKWVKEEDLISYCKNQIEQCEYLIQKNNENKEKVFFQGYRHALKDLLSITQLEVKQ